MTPSHAFDRRDFRRALSQFPTGVTIVTTLGADGAPIGVTASSFNAVSLDPPLVLWSVEKAAFSAATFRSAPYFAVNVLAQSQMDLSNRFAGRGTDKFRDVSWQGGAGGCPVFDAVAALFECRTWAVYDGGDHDILVGEVIAYRHVQGHVPLVFAQGAYAIPARHPDVAEARAG